MKNSSVSGFGRDYGLMHEVIVTGRKAGWGAEQWAKLAHNEEIMRRFREVLDGHAEIKNIRHIIDCDATPFVPGRLSVKEHQKGGQFDWSAAKVLPYLDPGQEDGKRINGHELRERLAGQPVLNANVLDYLLAHSYLIPEEWKNKIVFFWGTIYRYSSGFLAVRRLFWRDGRWRWDSYWLGYDWDGSSPALVRVS